MNKDAMTVIYILAIIATIVVVDVLFFRHRFWERLAVNIGIVLIYVVFYLAFLKTR